MWTLELFRVVDGQRLGELPLVDFSWQRSVRNGSMSGPPRDVGESSMGGLKFPVMALAENGWFNVEEPNWQVRLRSMFMPRKHGIMALWNGLPIVGGPIGHQVRFEWDHVELVVDGIEDILAQRFLVSENPPRGYSRSQITYAGMSLGTIAKRVLGFALGKPGGSLPITFDPDVKGGHRRTYQGFNVANLGIMELVQGISNVQNGPDVVLRPYVRDGARFAWRMETGTDTDPYIHTPLVHDFEIGAEHVVDFSAVMSTEYVAHRVYGVGAGQDVNTMVMRAGGDVPPGWPLIESVFSDSALKSNRRLADECSARINPYPVLGASMTVRADVNPGLGRIWPGDKAQVTVTRHTALPAATYDMRILSMSGDAGEIVKLDFDPVLLEVT